MRGYIDSIAKAIPGNGGRGPRRGAEQRMPRSLRPRATRETFVPVREAAIVRGLSRAA